MAVEFRYIKQAVYLIGQPDAFVRVLQYRDGDKGEWKTVPTKTL